MNTKHDSLSFSPFDLANEEGYQHWRKQKLAMYPDKIEDICVHIDDMYSLKEDEYNQIIEICRKSNSVIYRCRQQTNDKQAIRRFGLQLGLEHLDGNLCSDEDGISGLQVREQGSRQEGYIPYTNRAINWHTDGYYNTEAQLIRAMILHCVSDAAKGGENAIIDHEMIYLLMRDHDKEMVEAFMEDDVMTIPANIENGKEIRAAQTGPVFSIDRKSGNLHMRYTARTRSIEWKDTPAVRKATNFLQSLLDAGNEFIFHYRLQPGEGIISNNALHNRSGFSDSEELDKHRLFYRARYFDRVKLTDVEQVG